MKANLRFLMLAVLLGSLPVRAMANVVDTDPPDTTIEIHPTTAEANVVFTFSGSDPGGSGVAGFECQLDSGAFIACVSPQFYGGLVDGLHTFQVRAIDAAGNTDLLPASFTWLVDVTGPLATITANPSNPTASATASFSFTGDDGNGTGVAGFECQLDDGGFSACASPRTYAGLTNGWHRFDVRAIDIAGNRPVDPTSLRWFVDTEDPDTSFRVYPENPSSSSTALFQFSGSEGTGGSGIAAFECALDGGGFSSCSSMQQFPDLSEGSHTLLVRAIDAVGHTDPTPASFTWVVDSVRPETSFTATPTNPTASSSATFTFTGDDGNGTGVAGFQCSFGYAPFTSCSSPMTFEDLAEGYYTFSVRAIDAAGSTDNSPATWVWTVDLGPPDTILFGTPSTPTLANSTVFLFRGDDGLGSGIASYKISVDEGADEVVTVNYRFLSGLSDGTHHFRVAAVDFMGNVDPTPATFTWVVDTTPAVVSLTATPPQFTNATSATFTFTASDVGGTGVARVVCSIDNSPPEDCTSPQIFNGLSEGWHGFGAWAYDAAGNEGIFKSVFWGWTVDTTPLETTIDSGPARVSASNFAMFNFTADGGDGAPLARMLCSLDGSDFAECPASLTYYGLPEGSHTLLMKAVDQAGNVEASPAEYTWVVDFTPPETTLDVKPANPSLGSVSFAFSGSDTGPGPITFECQIDQGDFEECTSPKEYTGLTEGGRTFKVRAIDGAGRADESPEEFTWVVDLTGQDATISVGPAPGETTGPSVTFQFTAPEGGGSFFCTVDSGTEVECSTDGGYTVSGLTDGLHTLSVVATDALGNRGSPQEVTWSVDATPPVTTFTSRPALASNVTTVSFAFTTSETADTYCSTDNQSFVFCTSPAEFPVADEMTYTFYFRSTDVYGNEEQATAYSFTIDRTAPETTITQVTPERTLDATTTVEFMSSEANSTFLCQVNSDAPAACTSPFSVNTLPFGTHTIRITAIDAAGNADPTPATFVFTYTNDFDDDGLTEAEEAIAHTDPTNADTDGDGVKDGIEVKVSKTDPLDDDSDDDGLKDGSEDANGNGKVDPGETDPKNADTDDDGLTDGLELGLTAPEGTGTDMAKFKKDLDPSTKTDPTMRDTDGGGVFDGNEDANHNGKVDGKETNPNEGLDDVDADQDGLSNADEAAIGSDPKDADTDDDGVLDGYEGTADTDGDGTPDVLDLDSDNDGLPDGVEAGIAIDKARPGTNTNSPDFVPDEDPSTKTDRRNPDTDGDGIKDGDEDSNHNGRVDEGETDPSKADTDGDGMSDKDELDSGRNPLDASDGQPAPAAGTKKGGCSTGGANAGVLLAMIAVVTQLRRRRSG